MTIDDSIPLDDLLEALHDLKHDLGKYIRLPVSLLPHDASADEIRDAVVCAIDETRKGPRGVVSAKELWSAFVRECGDGCASFPTYERLGPAVERAASLRERIDMPEERVERSEIERYLGEVRAAIQALIEEVENG